MPENKLQSPLPLLRQIKIESPCPMHWDEMQGDASKRYCNHCEKNVHNFSEMDAESVSRLLESGQSICAQILRRPDGSIVTKERTLSRRTWFARFGSVAASVMALLTLGGCGDQPNSTSDSSTKKLPNVECENPVTGIVAPGPEKPIEPLLGEVEMGGAPAMPGSNEMIKGRIAQPPTTPKQ